MPQLPSQLIVFIAIISFSLFSVTPHPAQGEELPTGKKTMITAAGSGVNLGITRLLAAAFSRQHPTTMVDVPGSIGSKGAITAAAEGAIALGLVSRPLKAKEQRLGLVYHPYAQVAMMIGVHPTVAEKNITSAELVQIFQGNKSHWQDGNEIIVLAREEGDSGFQVLSDKISGFRQAWNESRAAKRWTLFFTDQDANRALSSTPYALGVADLGMITCEHLAIKPLSLDGIPATLDNVASGQYPLTRELAFVFRADKLSPEAKAFMAFVFSDAGKRILRENKYAPLQ